MRKQKPRKIILTNLRFDLVQVVYILSKRKQFKDSTLQNGILRQSKKKHWLKQNFNV